MVGRCLVSGWDCIMVIWFHAVIKFTVTGNTTTIHLFRNLPLQFVIYLNLATFRVKKNLATFYGLDIVGPAGHHILVLTKVPLLLSPSSPPCH